MLIQILLNKPQAIGTIVAQTPVWVWGLLAGLLTLGLSQVSSRTATLRRVTIMPVVMTVFSLSGTVTAFGNSPQFATVLLVWAAATAAVVAVIASMSPDAGTTYDRASRSFALPGSWIPFALILAIFLTKYAVGIELAMQPRLAADSQFSLIVATLFGLFSGIFTGRAARLWRMAARPASTATPFITA
jgi:hypothetical protein